MFHFTWYLNKPITTSQSQLHQFQYHQRQHQHHSQHHRQQLIITAKILMNLIWQTEPKLFVSDDRFNHWTFLHLNDFFKLRILMRTASHTHTHTNAFGRISNVLALAIIVASITWINEMRQEGKKEGAEKRERDKTPASVQPQWLDVTISFIHFPVSVLVRFGNFISLKFTLHWTFFG